MRIADDWYPGEIPDSVELGKDVYIDTAYSFAAFRGEKSPAMSIGRASGAYDRSAFIVGPNGRILVGDFTCLNACYLVCETQISIGAFCMFAWGATITDVWIDPAATSAQRRQAIRRACGGRTYAVPVVGESSRVTVEDNVWIGFDSVVLPGVTIGRGAVVGAKSIVQENVAAYAVVVGDPAREVRRLSPNDTNEARRAALATAAKS